MPIRESKPARKFLFLTSILLLSACAFRLDRCPGAELGPEPIAWFPSNRSQDIGLVLVVAGLNNNRAAMLPFIAMLQESGFTAALLTLAGHGADERSKHSATVERWREEMRQFYCEATIRRTAQPLFVLAYSTGAAVTTTFLDAYQTVPPCQQRTSAGFTAMLFLAPAITPSPSSFPLWLLTHLNFLHISLPSLAPIETRRYSSTSLASYRALFDTSSDIRTLRHAAQLNAIPTKIFIRPEDELVSERRLKKWLRHNGLSNWDLKELEGARSGHYEHMLIDRNSFSIQALTEMENEIVQHFQQNAKSLRNQ